MEGWWVQKQVLSPQARPLRVWCVWKIPCMVQSELFPMSQRMRMSTPREHMFPTNTTLIHIKRCSAPSDSRSVLRLWALAASITRRCRRFRGPWLPTSHTCTMVPPPDQVESLAWSALLVLAFRSISICVFLFVSINWDILLRSAIEIQACGRANPASPIHGSGSNNARNTTNGNEGEKAAIDRQRSRESDASSTNERRLNHRPGNRAAKTSDYGERPSNISRHQNSNSHNPTPPPPPYSLSPSKTSQPKPSVDTIIRLYEDIMASDSQTIEVQQETLCSQQDIIRSQAQVIRRMRQVLEEQDARIEELEEQLGSFGKV